MPAIHEEYERAAEEGVRFEFLSLPVSAERVDGRIRLTVAEMRLGEPDESGRRRPEPGGATHTEEYDAVFTAIGESADLAAFPTAMVSDDGWLEVGRDGRTTHEMVYVGGDLSHGPSTVVEAIGDGRRAAAAICARLAPGADPPPWAADDDGEAVGPTEVNPATVSADGPIEVPHLAAAERVAAGFTEEAGTIAAAAALAEIERCYSCGHCNSCGVCFIYCPDAAITWDDGPIIDYGVCKGCGICATECPGSAIVNVPEREAAHV
jgi:Pyruvate/2-oxoacid:ferredoxin oxidoreductase delta subunit